MTKELIKAMDEVRKYYPSVTMVIFNKYGQWNYCDDNFVAPKFDDRVDQGILEEASDSIVTLPSVYNV